MNRLRALLTASAVAFCCGQAAAHHVEAFDAVERAFAAYQENESYADVRAVLSEALREAPHDGVLHPDFGLVYAVYADTARFEGNPSFALQLADEGLALINSAPDVDDEMRNALIVSRAYALGDLGRYDEAVEEATIAALWLEQRFGADARAGLEAEIKGWQAKAGGDELPSVAQIAVDLLQRAETTLNAGDSGTAIALASRAMLPATSALSRGAQRMVNAWARSVIGAAFGIEGRHREAVVTLREAVDLLASEPWDGRSMIKLDPDGITELSDKVMWDVFIRLGASALSVEDLELADAALGNIADRAATPQGQYSLLVQRAGILMRSGDFVGVEALLREGEAAAEAAGNLEYAALARFYASVVRMRKRPREPDAPEVTAMLDAAREAAEAVDGDLRLTEYVLTVATRMAIGHAGAYLQALPVSIAAYDIFKQRQQTMADYETGQDAARRERRSFLEMHIGALFWTSAPLR